MKKLIFTALIFTSLGFNTTQNHSEIVKPSHIISEDKVTPDSDCEMFLKLAELASNNNLASIKGSVVKSIYYRTDHVFASTISIPGAIETLINDDPVDGATLFSFPKNYGSDETEARADFDIQFKKFTGCITPVETRVADSLDISVRYQNCTINFHTYKNGNINAWVMRISMKYSKTW
ncbi:MAG: hypothetical protein ABI653_03345 [Bacteroidota bacterium]